MTAPVRLYYHPRSPYSRLGVHLLSESGIPCEVIVFTGPPEGIAFNDPAQNPAKLAYLREDVARMTLRMGLPLVAPQALDTDFEPAILAGIAAELAGYGLPFAKAVSEARWGRGEDVADQAILKACAEEAGWTEYGPEIDGLAIKKAYVKHRRAIEEDQVFGVPFLTWGARKYWGHDRLSLFLEEYNKD